VQIIYCDRSRAQSFRRCPRLRFLEYHAGSGKRGLVPKRKSVHLVIGLAVHAGLEILLLDCREGVTSPDLRQTEDAAVKTALLELTEAMRYGVELDTIEQPDPTAEQNKLVHVQQDKPVANPFVSEESPIVLDFGGFDDLALPLSPDPTSTSTSTTTLAHADFSAPIYQTDRSPGSASSSTFPAPASSALSAEESLALSESSFAASEQANAAAAAGVDEFLKKELAALVEGMVRAYSRRRLKPLLQEFEVLEVEREGSWKLGEVPQICPDEGCDHYGRSHSHPDENAQLHWMSRHDALLLERSTSLLYLLSFKTTGSWDRRKKQDAEIDMQGLSEAVDVENRMARAWELIHAVYKPDNPEFGEQVAKYVDARTAMWLVSQPAPPRIYAVRYEYLLKGQRREEKDSLPRRYLQDTPLIRAWTQPGMTSDDRAFAASYKWWDISGRGHTLPYRTWKKVNVWEQPEMTVASWIDLLDQGEIQPDTYDEDGHPVDVLADQFISPVTVFRNADDMRDWLEQTEAQEIQVAIDVAKVHAARDEGERRSLLNRLFPQNRSACVWPGMCGSYKICYGGEDIRRDPERNSELYMPRSANHPIEMTAVAE
jgi:hypothetical protein